jgi:23S rRNA (guanosine2251-2'-O)-methyltransferase
MGAINNLNLFREVNLNAAIDKLKKTGYWIYASCLANNSVNINEVKFDAKSVLIVGNEDKGISPSLLAAADHLIKIPMFGAVQSLNVSVATGILLNIMRNNKK